MSETGQNDNDTGLPPWWYALRVKGAIFPVCAVLSWVALFLKILDARRAWRNPVMAGPVATLFFLAIVFTLSIPSVSARLDGLLGVPNLSALGIHCAIVAYSAATQIMLVLWSSPPAAARTAIRWRLAMSVAVIIAMAALFVTAGATTEERARHFLYRYSDQPLIAGYLLLYVLALAIALVENIRLCLRYAGAFEDAWLRRGLRAVALGSGLGLAYCASRLGTLASRQLGLPADVWEVCVPVFGGSGGVLGVLGLSAPSLGPHISAARFWLAQYRAYQRLYPLWAALWREMPDITLTPPSSALVDRLAPGDLGFRLYRKAVEIRDGQRALGPWRSPAAAVEARRLGYAAGLRGAELEAAVEAAVLGFALRARKAGRPGGRAGEGGLPAHGGHELSTELDWLIQVARAFAKSVVIIDSDRV